MDINYIINFSKQNPKLVNWSEFSKQELSIDVIEDFINYVDLDIICKYNKLPEWFIIKYIEKINKVHILMYQEVSEKFLEEYIPDYLFNLIPKHQKFSMDFIWKHQQKFMNYYSLKELIRNHTLPIEFLEKVMYTQHKYSLDFKEICTAISINQQLPESFIEKHRTKLDGICICIYQKLSEDFIRKYQNQVFWTRISEHQKLSDEFVIEFKDKIIWMFYLKVPKIICNDTVYQIIHLMDEQEKIKLLRYLLPINKFKRRWIHNAYKEYGCMWNLARDRWYENINKIEA